MSEKIDAIRNHILKGMPGRNIKHRCNNGFHTFRIEDDGPKYWLYISEETISDFEIVVIINFINSYHIIETFNQSENSKWLYLSDNGVKEVDEYFTK
jgi:hypothetical protein